MIRSPRKGTLKKRGQKLGEIEAILLKAEILMTSAEQWDAPVPESEDSMQIIIALTLSPDTDADLGDEARQTITVPLTN